MGIENFSARNHDDKQAEPEENSEEVFGLNLHTYKRTTDDLSLEKVVEGLKRVYEKWQADPDQDATFGPHYVFKNAPGVGSFVYKNNRGNFEELLEPEALKHWKKLSKADLAGSLPIVNPNTNTYIDPETNEEFAESSYLNSIMPVAKPVKVFRRSLPSMRAINSDGRAATLYHVASWKKKIEDEASIPVIDSEDGVYIDPVTHEEWVMMKFLLSRAPNLSEVAVSSRMTSVPQKEAMGKTRKATLYKRDEAEKAISNIDKLPWVDRKTGVYTEPATGGEFVAKESLKSKDLKQVDPHLKGVARILGRDKLGGETVLYDRIQAQANIDAYLALPQVHPDTGIYTSPEGAQYVQRGFYPILVGNTGRFIKLSDGVSSIQGRTLRNDQVTLYNKNQLEKNIERYKALPQVNDIKDIYQDKEGREWVLKGYYERSSLFPATTQELQTIEGLDAAGRLVTFYLKEEVDTIITERKKHNISDRKVEEEIGQSLNSLLANVVQGQDSDLRALVSIFGGAQASEMLCILYPDYQKLPLELVKSRLAEYLGDFLLSPPPFNLFNLEKGVRLLERVEFQDSFYEITKSACLSFLHSQKKEKSFIADQEIIGGYLLSLKNQTAHLQSSELQQVLQRVYDYYESVFQNLDIPDHIVDQLDGNRDFPDTFQRINIKEIADKQRILLADEMGIGKSASAILAKESLNLRQAIIMAPSNVLNTWQNYLSDYVDETGKQIGYFKPGKAPVVAKVESLDDLESGFLEECDYVLISQERLGPEYAEKLKSLNSDMLIVDEVHKVKNIRTGIRANAVIELADHMQGEGKYIIALSGTPIPNKVEDLAISLKLLYPEEFAGVDSKELVWQIINSDVLTLRSKLVQRMQMKSLAESVEMPQLHEEMVMSELSGVERDLYEVLLEEDELTASTKMATLRMFLMNPASLDAMPTMESVKVNDLQREVDTFFAKKERLVVFVNGYVENVIRAERSFLSNLNLPEGVELRVMHGETDPDERVEIQKELHARNKKILLIVSGQTTDVGVDFSAAQGVYEYNEPWTLAEKRQQVARVHRYGVTEEIEYKTSVTKGTIEEGIHEYIQEKERVISKIIKGIPITELEREFITEAEKLEEINLEVNPELAEYYFSSWNKLMKIFAAVKELGDEKFGQFLAKHGEDYAECYAELGSRSYQANVNRVAGRVIAELAKTREQNVGELAVLDVASGPEMLRQHIGAGLQGQVSSVDRNPFQLEGSDSGRAIVGSFTNLPLRRSSFDYVNLALGWHYTRLVPSKEVYERLEVLTELNRVLKNGGCAVISFIYSLQLKDREQFNDVVEAFGFKVVEESSGAATSGSGYQTEVVVLEKYSEVSDNIEDIVDILLDGNLDGIKFKQADTRLRDSRRIISKFELNGQAFDVEFNERDLAAYREERELVDQAEAMKLRAGGEIKNIPPEEVISSGFTRFYNGKRYVLYKKLQTAQGSVVVR